VRGEKKYCIGNYGSGMKLKTFLEEVAKCEVRCSNCHDKKTAKERNNFRWRRTLELGLRTTSSS